MEDERRRDKRVPMLLEVRWEGLSGKYSARINELGLGGCYIETLAQVMPGEEIQFEVQLPSGFWMPLRGTIVYHHLTLGFGVRFTGLTLMERNMLARVLDPAG